VSRLFPSWHRSMLTEIYLCHACSCHEILRRDTAGQAQRGDGALRGGGGPRPGAAGLGLRHRRGGGAADRDGARARARGGARLRLARLGGGTAGVPILGSSPLWLRFPYVT
jgi:hypothetical protein